MNNKCYIIIYELFPQRNVDDFHIAIKSYGTWAKINSNTWAVVTSNSAIEVRDNLKRYLTPSDRIFVVKSGIEAAWINAECSNEWLKNNL